MSGIVVSELAYAHPGGEPLFVDVGFTVSPGEHAALVGVNGTGKTTLLRILAGELSADAGTFALGGRALYMPQDVGMAARGATVRDMLVAAAPPALRAAGSRLLAAERALAAEHVVAAETAGPGPGLGPGTADPWPCPAPVTPPIPAWRSPAPSPTGPTSAATSSSSAGTPRPSGCSASGSAPWASGPP